MAEHRFTPGPWRASYTKLSEVLASNGALVATCQNLNDLLTLQANARLIAKSPELFAIARALAGLRDGLRNGNSAAEEAVAILAERAGLLVAEATGAA